MPTLTREIREQLLTYDEEFQKLARQHSEYEDQLRQLSQSSYLNLEDLQQQATLKKLKLRVKDAMERHIAQRLRHTHRALASGTSANWDRISADIPGVSAFFLLPRMCMVKDGYKFAAATALAGHCRAGVSLGLAWRRFDFFGRVRSVLFSRS